MRQVALFAGVSVAVTACSCGPGLEFSGGPDDRCARSSSDLVRAAEEGDAARVRQSLRNGADPNDDDDAGNTALACAGPRGNVEIVELLLAAGADARTKARDGDSVAEDAVLFCQNEVLERLLRAGAPADGRVDESPMLELALYSGNVDAVQLLLDHGADPDEFHPHRSFELFAPHRDDWPPSGCDVADEGVASALLAVLEAGAEPDRVLERSLWENQPTAVAPALEAGADPDREAIALPLAAAWGNAESTQLLLEAGADPHQGRFRPFDHAEAALCALRDHAEDEILLWCEAIAYLRTLTEQSSVPVTGLTWSAPPILEASGSGDVATVQLLLDAGADPNAVGEYGFTPLHAAASTGDVEIIELLVQAGARRPETGATLPSDVARVAHHPEAANLLAFLGT